MHFPKYFETSRCKDKWILYPFGFGLSYDTFSFLGPLCEAKRVTVYLRSAQSTFSISKIIVNDYSTPSWNTRAPKWKRTCIIKRTLTTSTERSGQHTKCQAPCIGISCWIGQMEARGIYCQWSTDKNLRNPKQSHEKPWIGGASFSANLPARIIFIGIEIEVFLGAFELPPGCGWDGGPGSFFAHHDNIQLETYQLSHW